MSAAIQRTAAGLTGRGTKHANHTPSDSADVPDWQYMRAVWVGSAGNLVVEGMDDEGSSFTYANVPAGTYIDVCAKRILATGTTATQLLIIY